MDGRSGLNLDSFFDKSNPMWKDFYIPDLLTRY